MVTVKDLEEKQQNTELLEKVVQRYKKSDAFYSAFVKDTDYWYKLYRNLITKPDNEFRSKVSVPVGFWTIETTVPRMVARPHQFKMLPVKETKECIKYAYDAKEYLEFVLRRIDFKKKTRVLAKDMKIYGSGIWKFGWDYQTSLPFVENIPLRSLRIDPSCSEPGNLQNAKYIIHITEKTESELRSNPNYNLKDIDFKKLAQTTSEPEDQSKVVRLSARGLTSDLRDTVEPSFRVMEHWGYIDGKFMLVTVLAEQYIIRNDKAPYKFYPFEIAINTEDPDNLLGIGDIEPVAHIIDDINTNRRMRTDNKNIRTNVMFERLRSAGIRTDQLVWRPGGFIDSNIANGITPISIPDTTQGSVEEEMLNYQLVEKATNTPGQIQGQLQTSSNQGLLNRTATAFAGAQQESNVRFRFQSESLDSCVEKTLTNLWKIVSSNVSSDQLISVVGEDGEKTIKSVPVEAINNEYYVEVVFGSASLEDDIKKREEAKDKLATLSGIFPESAQFFLKDYLLAMGDTKIDDIITAVSDARKKATEMGMLPKPPQINLSIGGEDMNSVMVGELLKNYFPLSPIALTPEMFKQTRSLMRGQTPEDLEADKLKIELLKVLLSAENADKNTQVSVAKIIADLTTTNEQRTKQETSEGSVPESSMEGVEETQGADTGESETSTGDTD